jgi:O-antigen ligase
VHVDPVAKLDADGTLNWRLEMWRVVWKEVPDHLFFGKGYGFIGSDLYLTQEAMRRGFFTSFEDTVVSGNYHNGWLTMVIPFGIWAVICFLWFCWSALKILRRNQRYGDPELKAINTFLLSYFVTRLIFYMVFYGQFDLDLMVLTGTVGLSVALNGGVRGPESVREVVIEDEPGLNGAVPSGAPQPA